MLTNWILTYLNRANQTWHYIRLKAGDSVGYCWADDQNYVPGCELFRVCREDLMVKNRKRPLNIEAEVRA